MPGCGVLSDIERQPSWSRALPAPYPRRMEALLRPRREARPTQVTGGIGARLARADHAEKHPTSPVVLPVDGAWNVAPPTLDTGFKWAGHPVTRAATLLLTDWGPNLRPHCSAVAGAQGEQTSSGCRSRVPRHSLGCIIGERRPARSKSCIREFNTQTTPINVARLVAIIRARAVSGSEAFSPVVRTATKRVAAGQPRPWDPWATPNVAGSSTQKALPRSGILRRPR